jgi:hypothetical protein
MKTIQKHKKIILNKKIYFFSTTNYILKHYLYLIIAFATIILKNKFKKIYKL